MVRRPVAAPVAATVELGESTDTDVLAEVDVTGDSGCLDPIKI